jgi:outer membrane protein assembly factor BamB
MAVLVPMLPAAASGPTISIEPGSGPPATVIRVSGSGFGTNQAIDIYFDTVNLALVVSDSKGRFQRARIIVPASAQPGKHSVTAVERVDGLSGQAGFLVRADWPQPHFDDEQTGYNPYENVIGSSNVDQLDVAWTAPALQFQVVASRGLVFSPNVQSVRAFRASTGSLVWETQLDVQYLTAGPEVLGGNLFVGSYDRKVIALDTGTGGVIWRADVGSFAGRMSVGEGKIFVLAGHGVLRVLKASTGALLWTRSFPTKVYANPTVAGGIVYVGTPDRELVALDASTGQELWTASTSGKIFATAVVGGGSVYVSTANGRLYAFGALTGLPLWRTKLSDFSLEFAPALADGVLYVGTHVYNKKDFVTAVRASNGRVLWSAAAGKRGNASPPSVANGVVYQGSLDRTLYALDAENGELLWRFSTLYSLASSPVIVNGMVFLPSDQLYAFKLS